MDNLKKQFIDYNNAGNVPLDGFSKEDFKSHPKVKALIAIMHSAMSELKKSAAKVFEDFNVNLNITATDRVDEPYVNAVNFDFRNSADKQNLLMSVNFNFSKLAALPAPEAYSVIYKTYYSALLEKRKSMPNANDYKFGRDVEVEEKAAENDQDFDREGKYVKPKNIIVEYIKAFFRKLFGFKTKEELEQSAKEFLENNSQNYEDPAQDIAKTFAENGINVNELFDNPPNLSSQTNDSVEEEKESSQTSQTESSSIDSINQHIDKSKEEINLDVLDDILASRKDNFAQTSAKSEVKQSNEIDENLLNEILASRYSSVVKQGNHQQATYLLGVFSQDEFNSLKSANESQLKAFCEKFARKFLENSGMDASSYKIAFDRFDKYGNERAAGTYIDYGTSQTININISQVKSINNPAEVVMILAHELTHAVDSTVNKQKGKTTAEGYGLLNNTFGVVGGLGDVSRYETVEVYQFVKSLTEVCYRLNPNERSAREGELIALEFMKGLNPNASMQKCIDSSIKSYNNYQNTVISDFNNLDKMLAEAKTIRAQVKTSTTREIIDARVNYLKQLKANNLLNISGVKDSIAMAKKINEAEMGAEGPSNG